MGTHLLEPLQSGGPSCYESDIFCLDTLTGFLWARNLQGAQSSPDALSGFRPARPGPARGTPSARSEQRRPGELPQELRLPGPRRDPLFRGGGGAPLPVPAPRLPGPGAGVRTRAKKAFWTRGNASGGFFSPMAQRLQFDGFRAFEQPGFETPKHLRGV